MKLKSNPELIALLKGDSGKDGKDGTNGEDATIDIPSIVAQLPPIYPMWIDDKGKVIDEIPGGVRLGEAMPLRIELNVELIRKAVQEALDEAGA